MAPGGLETWVNARYPQPLFGVLDSLRRSFYLLLVFKNLGRIIVHGLAFISEEELSTLFLEESQIAELFDGCRPSRVELVADPLRLKRSSASLNIVLCVAIDIRECIQPHSSTTMAAEVPPI